MMKDDTPENVQSVIDAFKRLIVPRIPAGVGFLLVLSPHPWIPSTADEKRGMAVFSSWVEEEANEVLEEMIERSPDFQKGLTKNDAN